MLVAKTLFLFRGSVAQVYFTTKIARDCIHFRRELDRNGPFSEFFFLTSACLICNETKLGHEILQSFFKHLTFITTKMPQYCNLPALAPLINTAKVVMLKNRQYI